MSEKKGFREVNYESSLGEIRKGGAKYVDAFLKIWDKIEFKNPFEFGKEMVFLGYAIGVVAGKLSDTGMEGFTLVLNGIKISLNGEERKEELQYALWDKEGNLHTSEEGFKIHEEGEQ